MDHTKRPTNNSLRRQRRQLPAAFTPARPSSMTPANCSNTSARRSRTRGPAPSASTNTSLRNAGSSSRTSSTTARPPRIRAAQSRSPSYAGRALACQLLDTVVKRREKTILTVAEQVIERLARHTRTLGYRTNRHPPITPSSTTANVASNNRARWSSETYKPPPCAARHGITHPQTTIRGSHQRPPPTGSPVTVQAEANNQDHNWLYPQRGRPRSATLGRGESRLEDRVGRRFRRQN